jgi:bacterioferritin (cytochrome b1)
MTLVNDMTSPALDSPVKAVDLAPLLNSFLRGEISAAETYRMAIEKVSAANASQTGVGLLHEMQAEHGRAAQALRDRIRELGGEPEDSSGAWGIWAKFTEGMANLLGDTASLKALKEGEEHGLREYVSQRPGLRSHFGRSRAKSTDSCPAETYRSFGSVD